MLPILGPVPWLAHSRRPSSSSIPILMWFFFFVFVARAKLSVS